ncbi:hypothetical protein B0H15DRAFT_884146 [Mycena belliarum]|uniref:F-box domain-containing protein n=1 Tax=Mycena belliarum TaxID=1033014 RepID=A0AAD6UAB1_9AGAR|nr:hypothetical protein B0H15DRAFT_884146 [Mycena belliae]
MLSVSSLFASKLGTNYSPPDEEITEIQALLVEPTLQLKQLDDEIADLHQALDKLARERAGLSAYIDAHKALLSPARRLPVDVLREIFTACLPSHRNCVMSSSEAPILLGLVCSTWRAISLSTPRLWSRLHIVEPVSPSDALGVEAKKLAQRIEATKTWLARSGQCPLSISMHCVSRTSGFTESGAQILQALFPFASRWRHVAFSVNFPFLQSIARLAASDVPMLRSVSLDDLDSAVRAPLQPDSLGFVRGPTICSLHLTGWGLRSLRFPVQWNTIKHLSLVTRWGEHDPLTSEMTLQVFVRCPWLETCCLHISDRPGAESHARAEDPVIRLSLLHTLALELTTPWLTVTQLFGRLSFPRLKMLRLAGHNSQAEVSYAPLFSHVPFLEKLEITLDLFTKASLLSFLRDLPPDLSELKISEFDPGSRHAIFDDEILERLISSPDSATGTPRCAALQTLEIAYATISDEALLRFIKSRKALLTRIVVGFGRDMELDIRPALQSLLQDGLHLELRYNPPPPLLSPWAGLADAAPIP